MGGISSAEGVKVFSQILRNSLPQVIVSTRNLQDHIRKNSASSILSSIEEMEKGRRSKPAHQRPDLKTVYVAPRDEVEQRIADIWQEFLGIERVSVHDNFFELGGNSLLATQLASRVRDTFQVELSLGSMFEAATVAGLAEAIVQEKARHADSETLTRALEELERLPQDEVQRMLSAEKQSSDEAEYSYE